MINTILEQTAFFFLIFSSWYNKGCRNLYYGGFMQELLQITIILVSSFLAIELSKKVGIPAVVGQLLVGIVIGPSFLNFVHQGEMVHFLSELGVILLMFLAGLEANLALLKKISETQFSCRCLRGSHSSSTFLSLHTILRLSDPNISLLRYRLCCNKCFNNC